MRKRIGINPEKKIVVKRLINRIFVYSAIKISAKAPPLYSVLNPETSSDSPSERSKGVRLVSAKDVANQINTEGSSRIIIQEYEERLISERSNDIIRIKGPSRIRAILTSYEIVWATLRSDPIKAYLEFEAHPATRDVYTFSLEMQSINNVPKMKKCVG